MFRMRSQESDAIHSRDENAKNIKNSIPEHISNASGSLTEESSASDIPTFSRLMKSIRAKDIMTQPVEVLRADMSLIETVDFFVIKNISGAPVVDHLGRILGVVSEKEIIANMGCGHAGSFMEIIAHCLKNKSCIAIPSRQLSVIDIMTSPAITVTADASVTDILALLTERRINRLPVIESDRRPIGIVTRTDMVRSYYNYA